MSKIKITWRFLNVLKATGKDSFYRDTELQGFGVKLSAKGKISFIAEGRIKRGGTKRITFGPYPLMPLDMAREKARDALLLMKKGLDPIKIKEQERQQRAKDAARDESMSVTLRTVLDNFLLLRAHKETTKKDYKNTFNTCLDDWLDQPVRDITRKMVEDRVFEIKRKVQQKKHPSNIDAGKAQAAKCMKYLTALCNHAMAEEVEGERLLTENPCDVLKQKKIDMRIKSRSSYLDKEDLRAVVEELSHVHHPDYSKQKIRLTSTTIADFLTLLIFTGLRRNEAASLEWNDVNFSDRYFTVRDTKNDTDHVVPMVAQVESILQRRYEADDKHKQWVFPANRGEGHLREPRTQIGRLREITGVNFMCHDLRRTFATVADSFGLDRSAVKRAMNHKTNDVTEGYIQTRDENLRKTFESIAQEINWWVDDGGPTPREEEEKRKEEAESKTSDTKDDELDSGYVAPQEAG
jgi:integrase